VTGARLGPVGLRAWLLRMLDRGGSAEVDPHELVEVRVVPLANGPLLVSALREHGIEATSQETLNLGTRSTTDARIMVARGNFAEADAVLRELTET
jgi:hypothetical protein